MSVKVPEKIKQQEINAIAWQACDTFRGVVDPSQYKDYILIFLFLKYISDVWKDHYEEYKKQYGDDETRIRRKLERERFVLPKGCSFDELYEQRDADNIGELINIALDKIEEANKAKLEGVFRNIDFNSEAALGKTKDRNRRLKNLIEDFANPKLDLRPSRYGGNIEDIIGNTYIYLIEQFATQSGKKAGDFYTPQMISILLAKLVAPKPGDKILDPACGSGSLLIEAGKSVGDDNFALYGQEVNGSTWALARMNMFLHGMDSARIEWCDTLNSPALVELDKLMRFNVVVANPPFSLDKWGAENAERDQYNRFWRGVPPKSKGDYAFITHMIETALPKEGRVGVVVPHGVLFRGAAEGRIRRKLIEENVLDAVIGLPDKLFPTTSIPVAILVFDRSREKGGPNEARKDVLFIDASQEFVSAKTQNQLLDVAVNEIVRIYRERAVVEKASQPPLSIYSYKATPEELEENDFNLNIPRYVDTFEEEEEIDVAAVQQEIEQLENELAAVRTKMRDYLKELGVS
ncbi:MAG TPA: type I restriction-modification system subunit M [Oculatellaceae cyanobacterium]|jgi:type I restriction enzyme M protein